MTHRWTIKKRHGQWRTYDNGTWHDTHDTLPEAHTQATQNAIADTLYQPGGLTLLAEMKTAHTIYTRHYDTLPKTSR